MIYRAHIVVLLVVSDTFWDSTDCYEAVAYTFGINADGPGDAVNIAVAAAQNATDRKGDFIGGVVVEAHCRCVDPREFEGSEKYFHQPSTAHGIFYVSGITSYGIPHIKIGVAARAELEAMKDRIARSGLPASGFVHPPLPVEPPLRVRMVCSVCKHWVEVDNLGLIYSFMDGLERRMLEDAADKKSISVAGNFMHRHMTECLGEVVAVYEEDTRWRRLDEAMREDDTIARSA